MYVTRALHTKATQAQMFWSSSVFGYEVGYPAAEGFLRCHEDEGGLLASWRTF